MMGGGIDGLGILEYMMLADTCGNPSDATIANVTDLEGHRLPRDVRGQ